MNCLRSPLISRVLADYPIYHLESWGRNPKEECSVVMSVLARVFQTVWSRLWLLLLHQHLQFKLWALPSFGGAQCIYPSFISYEPRTVKNSWRSYSLFSTCRVFSSVQITSCWLLLCLRPIMQHQLDTPCLQPRIYPTLVFLGRRYTTAIYHVRSLGYPCTDRLARKLISCWRCQVTPGFVQEFTWHHHQFWPRPPRWLFEVSPIYC